MWRESIREHYQRAWRRSPEICPFEKGPVHELPDGFAVLRFPPSGHRALWSYATCGLSTLRDRRPLELHMVSREPTDDVVELLYATAHFHGTGAALDEGHTVHFGRTWVSGSCCDHGLVSRPYLDGPDFEILSTGAEDVRFLWLLPITASEREYKQRNGLEALERAFEDAELDFADPARRSVVQT